MADRISLFTTTRKPHRKTMRWHSFLGALRPPSVLAWRPGEDGGAMRIHRSITACTATILVPLLPALAQLPPEQTVQLRLRQSPCDPNSNVEFYVVATLDPVDI